jgi:hypothetical protein
VELVANLELPKSLAAKVHLSLLELAEVMVQGILFIVFIYLYQSLSA